MPPKIGSHALHFRRDPPSLSMHKVKGHGSSLPFVFSYSSSHLFKSLSAYLYCVRRSSPNQYVPTRLIPILRTAAKIEEIANMLSFTSDPKTAQFAPITIIDNSKLRSDSLPDQRLNCLFNSSSASPELLYREVCCGSIFSCLWLVRVA